MPGIADIAVAGAPIAGGALLGMVAGNIKAPDVRALIAKDMDLLARIPEDQVQRRANLQHVIDIRVDDIIAGINKNRQIREIAVSYEGNWRDIVVFVSAILFTTVWWHVPHSKTNWLLMFIVMIVVTVIAGVYAFRGGFRAVKTFREERRRHRAQAPPA